MTSLPPENAPQLGTCDRNSWPHILHVGKCENWQPVAAPESACPECGSGDKARRMYQLNYSPPAKCINPWHDLATPESQPRPSAPFGYLEGTGQEFKIDCERLRRQELKAEWARQEREWEAHGEVPQENADYQHGWDDAMLSIQEPGEPVEPGAHPPPDERAEFEKWAKSPASHVCSLERDLDDNYKELDAVFAWEGWLARARAPQPAGSEIKSEEEQWGIKSVTDCHSGSAGNIDTKSARKEKVTAQSVDDRVTAQQIEEILGNWQPAARNAIASTNLMGPNEAPLAPSKLSAQELIDRWYPVPRALSREETVRLMTEYASSSNAALQSRVVRLLQEITGLDESVEKNYQRAIAAESKVTALEGQLREARECVQALSVTNQENAKVHQSEVERLQEALRDAIGAKDGWRMRAGKVLGDPKV